ncbi:extracellular solute-binding protein [Lachnospiraceae bacterium MD1]|jgi:putative aldouronate transport system substrate-binding protein|uniref:Extracellular solute-binding protein n=1 Tax=Variimorphobacter saccharofermentans TaxID=2755051 RepID=A0A839K249_9FIRM|nr:extracellular solute-binding protein [Variimorphobacter saccharofermentans]MBB2183854.1 extracellular solute-binding protein [Variimorphobacter saccharofermentans]
MKKRVLVILLCVAMVSTLFAGCGKKDVETNNSSTPTTGETSDKKDTDDTKDGETKEIKEFTAFFDRQGIELNDDNEIQQIIAEKIGAKCKETWLTGQTAEEAVGMLIASGEYPDFINWTPQLQEAGALVPIDEYLDKYPNIKNFWNETQWNSLRQEDGHIYSIPQFGNINEKLMDTQQSGEAFWIQTRVLKWDNYPKIESLDQLFDLLERYYAANPTMPDGSQVIPFEILCYDWYYFCLENPPQFLDGWPNNGRCIVDPATYKVADYNMTPTAKRYFQKLNEEYKKGIIDPEFMTMNHDQFLEKVASGRVLCMVEQRWDFQTAEDSIKSQKLNDCTYVPLGITIEPGMNEMYYAANEAQVLSGGLSITTSCKDVEGALQFVNDLLSPEIITLRSWGIEGVDYLVDENGLYYRTQEMRDNAVNSDYKASHICGYGYFPNYSGMNPDGKNAATPDTQPSEFFAGLTPEVQECLAAYGAETYVEMLDYNEIDGFEEPWYPMWSFVGEMTTETPGGLAWTKMEETKKQYLPQVVIAEDFEKSWEDYVDAYKAVKPEDFFAEVQQAVYDRIKLVQGKDVSGQ